MPSHPPWQPNSCSGFSNNPCIKSILRTMESEWSGQDLTPSPHSENAQKGTELPSALHCVSGSLSSVRSEVIGLACSGDPYLCPVQAIIRRVLYLCQNSAPSNTPLARVFHTTNRVTASLLTTCIRDSVAHLLWASFQTMCPPAAYELPALQPFFWLKSIPTSFAS